MNHLEREFIQKVPVESLPDLIDSESRKYGIKINVTSNKVYFAKIMKDLKQMLENGNREAFEKFAIDKLTHNGKFAYKADFVKLLVDDPKYAYCWAKYINLKKKIPEFIKKVKNLKIYEADAEAFIRRMNGVPLVDLDMAETCKVFNKSYKLITVATPTAMDNFLRTYFIQSKPEILGIDVESIPNNSQVSIIQLATKDWCCIIDVLLLSKHFSNKDWTKIFELIFHPSIIRIGFDFPSDYFLIGNTFSHVSPLMQSENGKGLCLKKLFDSIVKNPKAKNAVLHGRPFPSVSLSNASKAILGFDLDKNMQRSDWAQRPLTNKQKIYAVKDAVVVLLIKEKIENDLKKNLGPTQALIIVQDAFVSMKAEKDASIEKLTKTFGGVSI
uniref:3'-5' exonuclease domain-containing protein n=1 Tax=Panagrolaimus davidi TaxID=227884 RepID=A0A914Q2H9_9BILA